MKHAPSVFSRYALAAYWLLVLYASLYPFSGWRWQGLSPLDFVTAPLPRYITLDDIWLNVAGYLPLGLLAAASLRPRWTGWRAWLLASIACSLMSFAMETSQAFLPVRVSSNVDWITNTLGGALGAALAVWLLPRLSLSQRVRQLRERWFARDASLGLLLLAAWPLALLWPPPALFATGQVAGSLAQSLIDTSLTAPDVTAPFARWFNSDALLALTTPQPMGAQQQAWIAATMLMAALWTSAALTHSGAPRVRIGLALTLAGLTAMSLSAALGFGPEHALAWATPAATHGLALGLVIGLPLTHLPRRLCAALALIALICGLWWINQAGPDPYYAQNLQTWSQGLFIRMFGLPQWLSWLWPYVAVLYLLGRVVRPGAAT
ncbi:MAG: VanZ family protein [Thiomonas sp.]|uniref:VanZ-like domain-containing protein n=1 Tax=mine drainage metagenome TaxID=410659 RepID=E6PU35_9ZZZZ